MQNLLDRMISRLPDWLRWVLFLPAALLGDLASQTLGHLFVMLALPRSIVPYGDEFIWRILAPVIFVLSGTKVAPRYWFYIAGLLLSIKSLVAIINIRTLVLFWQRGGSLAEPALVTQAPIWWSIAVQFIFIMLAVLMLVMDRGIRKERSDAYPVLEF